MNLIKKIQTETAYEIISRHEIGDIRMNTTTRNLSCHSKNAYQPGEIMGNFSGGTTQNHATYLTIQIGKDHHVFFEPVYLQYINHSCDPNMFFDTTAMHHVCILPIEPGDELGWFYPSTEWDMVQPFECNCGSKNCLQSINGAAHISLDKLSKYRLSDFILQQLKQKR